MDFSHIQPTALWQHFAALNAVPRPSKKEERVIAFMKAFGENLGLTTIVDQAGNVIIKKAATAGMEDRQTVILQSHLDMVHQKNASTVFDFDQQGIEMYQDGDWIRAKGTTLGADNGIGVAAIMALLASTDIPHPALEAFFTIDEETGMTRAKEDDASTKPIMSGLMRYTPFCTPQSVAMIFLKSRSLNAWSELCVLSAFKTKCGSMRVYSSFKIWANALI